jgi:hypothetical protein
MMKKSSDYGFSEISSFEDFRIERERLIFRSKLIEAKLNLSFLHIRTVFSASNIFLSLAKSFILPKISDLLGGLLNNKEEDLTAE